MFQEQYEWMCSEESGDEIRHKRDPFQNLTRSNDTFKIMYQPTVHRRLPAVPRQAAIPFSGTHDTLPVPEPELEQSTSASNLLTLGGVTTALVCLGCALKRKFYQLKRQASLNVAKNDLWPRSST